jgi:hypothetical protein
VQLIATRAERLGKVQSDQLFLVVLAHFSLNKVAMPFLATGYAGIKNREIETIELNCAACRLDVEIYNL